MSDWIVYFNPKCGTCQKLKKRLEERGVAARYIEYLKNPPPADEFAALLKRPGLEPEKSVRVKEPIFEELGLAGKKLSAEAWGKILHENPVLLQRPIVVRGRRAVIARPAEAVDVLFGEP